MAEGKRRVGRPRTRTEEMPSDYVGFRAPRELKERLEAAAGKSGRSLSTEAQFRLEQSFAETAYRPEIGALAEVLARVMAETGKFISGANQIAGHGHTDWIDDPYAFDQALKAAMHVLLLSRPEGSRAPHGLFPTLPNNPKLSRQIGKQVTDGILEVMRGREHDDSAIWSTRIREKLGAIGARLARQPSPDDYFLTRTKRTKGGDAQ